MKVAFIQANDMRNAQFAAPLWPAYLKAYAEQYVQASWSVAYNDWDIVKSRPDVLAISSMSQDWPEAVRLIGVGKAVGARVIVGGHHVTGTHHSGDGSYEVVHGPGEAAFASILAGANFGQPGSMDDIPIPDHAFGRLPGHKPTIMTSRGCAYKCSFCSPKTMWAKIQFHSPRRVVDEMGQIANAFPGMRRLSIWDDLFAADRSRVAEIHSLMSERGLNLKLNSGMRAELVDANNCRLWKSMGLTRVGIGGESGSNRILKRLKSKSASVEQNQRALDIMHEHGMAVGTGIIFGSPTETEADVISTYEWLLANYKKGKLMNHEVNILNPMPGTPVWHDAERAGLVSEYGRFDWSRLQHQSMGFRTEGKYKGSQGWMRLRREDGSVYLNEDVLPQETLFEMIDYYEKKIRWCSPAQAVRQARNRAEKTVKLIMGI